MMSTYLATVLDLWARRDCNGDCYYTPEDIERLCNRRLLGLNG